MCELTNSFGILYNNFYNNLISYPFNHSTYKFFSDDICDNLIDNINQIIDLLNTDKNLSDYRYKINLNGNTKDGFDNIEFIEKIKNIEPLNTVLKAYQKEIPINLYKKYNNDEPDIVKYCLMIVCDKENYEIGPHTDSYVRNATMVTYLGPINNNENLGLFIYKDLINRHKNEWKKIHYSFDNFEPIKQIEYYKGSTIDFKVSKNSFHGVPKIKSTNDRYRLQFFIF